MKSRNGLVQMGANGSAEVASFPSFLFPLVVFCFTYRGMLCFSGAVVKGACSVLVVLQLELWLLVFLLFRFEVYVVFYLSSQELLRSMQVLFLFLVVLFSPEENYFCLTILATDWDLSNTAIFPGSELETSN